jgi:hypothetical protein
MRARWNAILAIVSLAAMAACGSYSAPNNSPRTGADSTGDSTGMNPSPTYP